MSLFPKQTPSAPRSPMTNKENGGVIIALENPILDADILENTPSNKDGLDKETEAGLRWHGCKLIQYSCLLLKLPAATLVTGQLLFQRYFYSKSLVRCKLDVAALACIWLASKVEESPRRLRNITNVLLRMRQIRRREKPRPILVDDEYHETKRQLTNMERKILKDLGFCVHVNHPYKYLFYISNWLQQATNRELLQGAWNYMNDSLMTNLYVRYHPKIITCACLHLSARILGVPLPQDPAWYEIFGVGNEEMEQICFTILELYSSEPTNLDVLEARCELARKIVDEKRLEEKKVLAEKYKHLKVYSPLPSSPAGVISDQNTQDSKSSLPTPTSNSNVTVELVQQQPMETAEPAEPEHKSVSPQEDDDRKSRNRSSEDVVDRYDRDRDRDRKHKYDSSRDRKRRDDDRYERRRYRDEDYENYSQNRRHSRSRSPYRKERRDRDRERDRYKSSSRYDESRSSRKYDDYYRRSRRD